MANNNLPKTMRAWQYKTATGGIEKTMRLNTTARLPKRKPGQHLVKISAAALNPVDHKPAEAPYVGRLLVPNPATPACDFAGHVIEPADGSSLRPGQAVFGVVGGSPFAGGAMAEYQFANKDSIIALPEGVSMTDAAGAPITAWTAYQCLQPHVKVGDKVFINGGSGGTGVYGIQIAKALGCHVTVTCSTANVDLCKRLGADEVIDYKKQDIVSALKDQGQSYAHVVDNVCYDPILYWKCHEYTKPGAKYIWVGASPSLRAIFDTIKMRSWPGFLGGGKRPWLSIFAQTRPEELQRIGQWMQDGTIKAVIDEEFAFEDVPKAYTKLKTGRAKGKIIVNVVPESQQ